MINIDATFDIDSKKGAAGVVIRDYTGQCVAAAHVFLPHVVDAHMAEANNLSYLFVNNYNICCIIWICLILLILLLFEKSVCAGARPLHFSAYDGGKVFCF
jgi:hypothetical protein